jgi:hypothetical protein
MKLYKVETGLIDDDFIHGRVTLKVFTDLNPTVAIPCRVYKNGRVVGIIQRKNGDWQEYKLAKHFYDGVKKWIDVHRSDLFNKQTVLFP